MDYLRCGGSHVLIGIRGPREDTVEFLDHVITRWVIYQPYNILLMEETFKAFRGGRCIRHLRSLEVVATFTNAVLWAGTHNPQMTNFSRPCMISTCTQTTGRRFVLHIAQEFTLREMTGGLCKTCLSGDVRSPWKIEVLSGTIYIIYPICEEPTDINPSGFAVMTNPGVHFVLKISQYILLTFLEVTVSYGQLAFSSGFFSLVYWDHDGDDILQGNHITVGQRRKKETGRKVRGIDIDQEEDSLFLLCCLM
uniref:Uncharacterized protein n=1 Tax=Oryza glumipatula TaxID=40148 RepID=A0A0E0AAL8_9ORYZ